MNIDLIYLGLAAIWDNPGCCNNSYVRQRVEYVKSYATSNTTYIKDNPSYPKDLKVNFIDWLKPICEEMGEGKLNPDWLYDIDRFQEEYGYDENFTVPEKYDTLFELIDDYANYPDKTYYNLLIENLVYDEDDWDPEDKNLSSEDKYDTHSGEIDEDASAEKIRTAFYPYDRGLEYRNGEWCFTYLK